MRIPLLTVLALFVLAIGCQPVMAQFNWYSRSIPTRDGKVLAADLYSTDTTAVRPVILIQTPYNKNYYRTRAQLPQASGNAFFDTTHYHYVILDWRGFYGSTAAAVPNYNRGLDGYDAVQWITQQAWSNDRVGTWGPSALGNIQFMTMQQQHPAHICAAPLISDPYTRFDEFYPGGVYAKQHTETLEQLGFFSTDMILAHPTCDVYWTAAENQNTQLAPKVIIPTLMVTGWFDHYPDAILDLLTELRTRGGTASRSTHRLIVGPWTHSNLDRNQQAEWTFENAQGTLDSTFNHFFDRYLRNIQNNYEQQPIIKYFQMGENEWYTTDDWDAVATLTDSIYLAPGGQLLFSEPGAASSSALVFDPRNPSPSYGGALFDPFDPDAIPGPRDISNVIENRADALVFSTAAVDAPLKIAGAPVVYLSVAADRTDTDYAVRLTDVWPDGKSMILNDGIARGRFRNGCQGNSLLTPGQQYQMEITLPDLALTLEPGHSLRIVITGSNYPRYGLNLNNGGAMYTAGDTLTATSQIGLGGTGASYLKLPLKEAYAGCTPPEISFAVSADTLCSQSPALALSATPAGGTFSGQGVSGAQFSPAGLARGLYHIDYTYTLPATSCTSTARQSVYVVPAGDNDAISFQLPYHFLCQDSSVLASTLTASPAGGTFASTVVQNGNQLNGDGLAPGTYRVTYTTDIGGCSFTKADSFTVAAAPAVSFEPAIDQMTLVYNDANLKLTGTPPGGVFSGDNLLPGDSLDLRLPSPEENVETSGTITYTYTAAPGCTLQSKRDYIILACVAVDNPRYQTLGVYPNPASTSIQLSGLAAGGTAALYNLQGQLVLEKKVSPADCQIDIQHLPAGMYVIKTEAGSQQGSARFIKKD